MQSHASASSFGFSSGLHCVAGTAACPGSSGMSFASDKAKALKSRESLRYCNNLNRQLIVVLYHFNSRLFPN